MFLIGHGRMARRLVVAAILFLAATPGILMAAQRLEPWKINYLNGLGAESKHQYGRALRFFEEARKQQSRPIKNEWFAQYGRHDYDPQYHIARCLLKLGANAEYIEAWIAASSRGGVTSPKALKQLLDELHARQGTPVPVRTPTPAPTPFTPVSPSPTPQPGA